MTKSFISLFLLLIFSVNAFSQQALITTRFYKTNKNTNLKQILENELGISNDRLYGDEKLYHKIRQLNPRIEDVNSIKSGTEIYIEYPFDIESSPYLGTNSPRVTTRYFKAEETTSLKRLLEGDVGFPPSLLYGASNLFNKIKKWNPRIRNFKSIPAGTIVYLEYPYGTQFGTKKKEVSFKQEIKVPKKIEPPKKSFTLFSFFAASKGTFTESLEFDGETAQITSTQNSPISFGIGTAYFYKPRHTFSGSVYFSSLTGSVAEDTEQEIDIPTEVGTNIYYNFSFPTSKISIYTGIDHELFTTYNTDEIITGPTLYKTRGHNISFLTAGFGKNFSLGSQKLLFKASLSKSIRSSSTSTPTLTNNGSDVYSGIKYLLYLNFKASNNFLVHGIFKQHLLNGPTELSILRIGLGVGYKFF